MEPARRTRSMPAGLETWGLSRRNSIIAADEEDGLQLTEMNAPPPARREERLDNLENRQREARRKSITSRRSSNSRASIGRARSSRDIELNEVAAPSPVRSRTEDSDYAVTLSEEQAQEQPGRMIVVSRWTALRAQLYVNCWLILFSLFGTLARLGVEAITLYPNSPFPSRVLWANIGGSFFMGYLLQDRQLFREQLSDPKASDEDYGKVKKTIPLFIGLSTGFCGSFTSFSSYIRDSFLAMSNALDSPSPVSPWHTASQIESRNGGFSFLALLAILIVHPAMSIAALQTGAHFAILVQPVTPSIPFQFIRKVLDPLSVLVGIGGWIGAIILTVYPPGNERIWRNVTMSSIFAPIGCLLRYYVSKHTNARIPSFPLGTFIVNIFGTIVIGMVFDLQHAWNIGASPDVGMDVCSLLQGVSEGFCGCLTTVSTWVAELVSLRRRHAWTYGTISVGVGLAVSVLIMGTFQWVVGLSPPTCI